jgi:hypothetical protein
MNLNFWRTLSSGTATVTGRSDGPSIDRGEPLPHRRSSLRSPFFPLSAWHSIALVVCCPGITSMRMWSGLHWADWPFYWYQDQGAPPAHSSGSSRHIGSRGTRHQPGTSYPTPKHQDPIHPIQIHKRANQRGHWDRASSKQHEQGGWSRSQPVMETTPLKYVETPHPRSSRFIRHFSGQLSPSARPVVTSRSHRHHPGLSPRPF